MFGGARYIATGCGFATTRISFSDLFSRFASTSILKLNEDNDHVAICDFMDALADLFSVFSLCMALFLFNPHQLCSRISSSITIGMSSFFAHGFSSELFFYFPLTANFCDGCLEVIQGRTPTLTLVTVDFHVP